MKRPGQVALVPFPRADLTPGKPRPILLVSETPGPYADWLVCMFSTRLYQEIPGFDEVLDAEASDFVQSGLKTPSIIRVSRLAVVTEEMLLGCIGTISDARLQRIRETLANWIQGAAVKTEA